MNISAAVIALADNGGRRSGFDRRQFLYTTHIPERRIMGERRRNPDRRRLMERRYLFDRRAVHAGRCSPKDTAVPECGGEKTGTPERQ